MNKILKFKHNLLHNIATNPDLKVKKILYDTKFLLYCFRHFKYADNSFNLKVSETILANYDKYQDLGEKMRAIRLFTQLHLSNNLKITPSHSEFLSTQVKDIQEFPNFRWLLNIALLNHNSGLECEEIWKKLEQVYSTRNFFEEKSISAEDQVKLALLMGLSKRNSVNLWRSLLVDLISSEEEFNPSQRIILIKALTSFDSSKVFEKTFEEEKFKPFVSALISRAITTKENLSLKEAVSLLLASEKSGILGEKALSEVEPVLFEKVRQIPKEYIYLISQYYSRVMLNKKRMEFLKNLRMNYLSKLDRKITLEEADHFNTMNNYMMKNGIIGSIEYNEPYQEFIVSGQYSIFEYLYLAKMKNMSFNEVMSFSFLIQGQLSKQIFKLSPETLYRTLSFLEFRGDISDNFVNHVISVATRCLRKNNKEDPKNLFFSNMILIKYDSTLKKNNITNTLSDLRTLILKDKDNNLETELLIYILNNPESPKEVKAIIEDIAKLKFQNLSETSLFEHLSLIPLERIKADEEFKNKIVDYVAENFDYLKVPQLCKIPHIITGLLPANLQERFMAKIKEKTLTLEEVESFTRNINVLTKEARSHIQNSFLAHKGNINVSNLDTVFITVLRIFGDNKDFDKKFIQQLMQVITTRNSYLNQKNLNKFIDAYSKLEK